MSFMMMSIVMIFTSTVLCKDSLEDSIVEDISTTIDSMEKIRHLLPKANIDEKSLTEVTVQLGNTAFLPCVFNTFLYDQITSDQVSWFRRRDWQILTTGILTYTKDQRFVVFHEDGTHGWPLQIKFTKQKDNGTYECQLSTKTGVVSKFVRLKIVVPQAIIEANDAKNDDEYCVEQGGPIELSCTITNSLIAPHYVTWYRNKAVLNHDLKRPDIKMTTTRENQTSSNLYIKAASNIDIGNYTCAAAYVQSNSIKVFVSAGDNTAAIQRRNSVSDELKSCCLVVFIASALAINF